MSGFESLFRAFRTASDDRNEDKWRRILASDGFLTPETLLETSKRMVNERDPYDGTPLWKIADAVLDVVGTEAAVWAGSDPLNSPSSVWTGATGVSKDFQYMHGVDIRAMAVFAMRLEDECFNLLETLSYRYSSHFHAPTPRDHEWVNYLTQRGVSLTDAVSGYPPHNGAELVWERLKPVLQDPDLAKARLSGLSMARVHRHILSILIRECPDHVLHAHEPDSIAARVFEVDPSVFDYPLGKRPGLLNGRLLKVSKRVIKQFFLEELSYHVRDDDHFSAILQAVESSRLDYLHQKMHRIDNSDKRRRKALDNLKEEGAWKRRLELLDGIVRSRQDQLSD